LFEGGYEKPFLVTYLNTSAFALYLVPFLVRKVLNRRHIMRRNNAAEEYQPLVNDPDLSEELYAGHSHPGEVLTPLTIQETMNLAFMFCFLWFIANWSVNASLDYTSVASTTILSSLSGFFTLIIGRLFRVETLTIGKTGAVITSFAGSILVASSDSRSGSITPPTNNIANDIPNNYKAGPLLGDLLALLSAMFYALYVVLLKVRIREESRIDMQLFFGFVGLIDILFCWPMGLFLHFIGVERFELPTARQAIIGILLNMGITLSSDFIYVLAMLKTTPLVVTIGLSLTIPLAVLGDFFLGTPITGQVLLGAALVLVCFVAVGIQSSESDDLLDNVDPPRDVVRLHEEGNPESSNHR